VLQCALEYGLVSARPRILLNDKVGFGTGELEQ
jgi:hypothetical protein